MACNREVAQSLEMLLESLIKMVGKTNQNMDHLQKRVTQMEMLLKEQKQPRIQLLHISPKSNSQH